jgi:O-antigen/teichoic acid export membrane protein
MLQTLLALIAYVGINAAAGGYDDALRAYLAVAGLSLFVDLYGNIAYDQLLAQERMVATSAVEIVHIAARIGLAGAALAAGLGLLGVYAATILTGIGRSAALWILLRRTGVHPARRLDWTIARPLVINSAPLALAAFVNITYAQIDKLLAASLLTNADAGHLNAAFVIVFGAIEILSTTILVAVYPMMSRAYRGEGDAATFQFMVEKLAYFTLLIGVPLALIVSLFAPALIVPLFGAGYLATADILRVLIWYAAITMVVNVFAQALMVENRQRLWVIVRVIGLAIKLGLSLLLMPRIGVIGAAVASTAAELLVLSAAVTLFRLDVRSLVPRLIRVTLLGLIVAGVMAALGTIHPLIGMAGVIIYGLGVPFLLRRDDRDLLYRLIAAMPGGSVVRRVWRREGAAEG